VSYQQELDGWILSRKGGPTLNRSGIKENSDILLMPGLKKSESSKS
jgi:hypothetical protein